MKKLWIVFVVLCVGCSTPVVDEVPPTVEEPTVDDIPESMLQSECDKYPWPPSCSMVPHAEGRKLCEKCKEGGSSVIPSFDIPEIEGPGSFLSCDQMPPDCSMLPLQSAREKCESCRAASNEGQFEISPGVQYDLPPTYEFPVVFSDALNYFEYDNHFKKLDVKRLKELGFNTFYILPEYHWSYDDTTLHLTLNQRFASEKVFKENVASFINQAHYYGFNVMLGVTTIGCHATEVDDSGRAVGCQPISFPCSQFSPSVPTPNGNLCTLFTSQLVTVNKDWLQFAEEHNVEWFTFGEWDTPFDNGPYFEVGNDGLRELITFGNSVFTGKLTVGTTRDVKGRYDYAGLDQLGMSFYPEGNQQQMLSQWVTSFDTFSSWAVEDGLPAKILVTETYLPDKFQSWMGEFAGGAVTSVATHSEREIAEYYDTLFTLHKESLAGVSYTWSDTGLGMENKPLLQAVWKKHFGMSNVVVPQGNNAERCCPITLPQCGPEGGEQCCVGDNCPDFAKCAPGVEPCCPRSRARCY